jgi:glycosyltransferase involved in cell wall biosynthesis
MNELVLVVPGRLDQLTGGYLYDRNIVEGLRIRGRRVQVIELSAQADQTATFAAIADGATIVVDGLALPDLQHLAAVAADRLRFIALVHHPLAAETGLSHTRAEQVARLEAALLPQFRGVVCPSRKTAAAVASYGVTADRIAVVPPGTAKPRAYYRRSRRGPARSLLCVASLVPRKGHRVLIEALARVRHLDWELLCIGSLDRDAATTRSVRGRISAARLGRRIVLAGEWLPAALTRAYRAADIFVRPSFHEGYGMAYAEAMAHGLPIIATTAGAIPETVPRNAGLLVPPGDPAALARALRRVLSEPSLAGLATGSRAQGERLPTWSHVTKQWESALDWLGALDPQPPGPFWQSKSEWCNTRSLAGGDEPGGVGG